MERATTRGVILEVPERDVEAFQQRLANGTRYSDVVDREVGLAFAQPCVVTVLGHVVAVGRLTRERYGTTTRRVTSLSRGLPVGPWDLEELAGTMPRTSAGRLLGASGSRALPPVTWRDFVEAIRRVDANAARHLEPSSPDVEAGRNLEAQREERDAFLLSFELAGLRRPSLELPVQRGRHFLEGLETTALLESHIVTHDALAGLPGWDRDLKPGPAYGFSDAEGHRLTVMNVGGDKPEHATGVDLIYWRESPNAFVLVQYKRLRDKDGRYWPSSDANFDKELARMRRIAGELALIAAPPASALDYRLIDDAFFFKFCPPVQPTRDPRRLLQGLYVPLSYWDVLVKSGELAGPSGGISIGYDNASRWLSNTLFAELVGGAWLGTSARGSDHIAHLVRSSLGLDRTVVLAIEHPRKSRRSWRKDLAWPVEEFDDDLD